jgi:imidazoleglycerol-phosphate dehydratase
MPSARSSKPAAGGAPRSAEIVRKTAETDIRLSLNLDGSGVAEISTGVGFLDHMLTHIARHGLIDLTVQAKGDLHVDFHHTVEDVGIALGTAIAKALGDKAGIRRFGWASVPMDEALANVAIDLSGRAFLVFNAKFKAGKVGEIDTELFEEFFRAFAANAKMNLHINAPYGGNNHHVAEAIFKCVAKALAEAVRIDPRERGVPSTKGIL